MRFTQQAIDNNDLETVKRCFEFVEENLDKVIFRIENALVISYLGKLDFDKNPRAERKLYKRSMEILKALREYRA